MGFGVGAEYARLKRGHRLLGRRIILMRAGNYGARDGGPERAGLGRTRNLHRSAGDIGVNLHYERVLLGDAAAVDDLLDLDAVLLEAADDGHRTEGGGLDQR